jgi:hypothetical protein
MDETSTTHDRDIVAGQDELALVDGAVGQQFVAGGQVGDGLRGGGVVDEA